MQLSRRFLPVRSAVTTPISLRLLHLLQPHTYLRQSRTMSRSSKGVEDFLSYVDASPTPFHAVHNAKLRLDKAGFSALKERDAWASTLEPGHKYYVTRNASTIVAFAIGKKWKPGNPISVIGAHTDSPCLRIKPNSKRQADGFIQVGVEKYGGGTWHTWFDRDLSIAGRVMVKGKDGSIRQTLIKVEKPILRIPNLAIHLSRKDNFEFNFETQLLPIAGMVAAGLKRQEKTGEGAPPKDSSSESTTPQMPLKATSERHEPYLIEIIAKEANAEPADIIDFEILLYDTQKACVGGMNDEFVFSARLDNLCMTYCSIEGLLKSLSSPSALENDSTIRMIACFDHEEIGSETMEGAASTMLPAVIRRLCVMPSATTGSNSSEASYEKVHGEESTAFEQTLSSSMIISADMSHSVHPNYSAKYESEHRPEMNKGTVIKVSANVRYASTSPGIVLLQEIAKRAKQSSTLGENQVTGVPLQFFVVRNDSLCGSTIGPKLSALTGARTLDLGNAQLAMHSIRETMGAHDIEHAVSLFESYFVHYGELEPKIIVD